MRKTLILACLAAFVLTQSFAPAPVLKATTPAENNKAVTYNVRIALVRTNGQPVTGGTGLHGYWARNEATGAYVDPTNQEGNEFEGLPAGTYTFGAYPGNWDGAVPQTVTLSNSQAGPDGFITITLVYWVE
jgi:hypothetical protein